MQRPYPDLTGYPVSVALVLEGLMAPPGQGPSHVTRMIRFGKPDEVARHL